MDPRAWNVLLVSCLAVACAACGRTQVAPTAVQEPQPSPPPQRTGPVPAPAPAPAEATAPFNRTLELQGIRFVVDSPNRAGGNTVRIATDGLSNGASIIDRDIPGTVVGADVGDLDADGSPEIYVYVGASDTSGRASLVAYSANRGKSLGDIYLPPIEDAPGAAFGFIGPEQMAVVELSLARRFPIQGGKTRQLRYRLHAGEAGWQFRLAHADEF
jgi:hypothetical protein